MTSLSKHSRLSEGSSPSLTVEWGNCRVAGSGLSQSSWCAQTAQNPHVGWGGWADPDSQHLSLVMEKCFMGTRWCLPQLRDSAFLAGAGAVSDERGWSVFSRKHQLQGQWAMGQDVSHPGSEPRE